MGIFRIHLERMRVAGLDLYANYGPGKKFSTEELESRYEDLLAQFESGAQTVSYTGGGGGSTVSYINRDQAFMQIRRMLRKLHELKPEIYPAVANGVSAIQVVNHSVYSWNRTRR